jgi:hypothetical protein
MTARRNNKNLPAQFNQQIPSRQHNKEIIKYMHSITTLAYLPAFYL